MDTWASLSDVGRLTGTDVSLDTLRVAQGIIELAADRTYEDTPRIKRRDLIRLQRAVAYQAKWLHEDPERLADAHVESERVGPGSGVQVTHRPDPASLVVAPLAMMALRRLSWKRSGTINVVARRGMRAYLEDDDRDDWVAFPATPQPRFQRRPL